MRPQLIGLLFLLALGGCAAERGEILGESALGYRDVAFVSAHGDDYFWLAPPPAGPHGAVPAEMQIPPQGIWVREGWFVVEFQCFSPQDVPATRDPILPESDDQKPVFLSAGHRYMLACSPTRMGDFNVYDQGRIPAH